MSGSCQDLVKRIAKNRSEDFRMGKQHLHFDCTRHEHCSQKQNEEATLPVNNLLRAAPSRFP